MQAKWKLRDTAVGVPHLGAIAKIITRPSVRRNGCYFLPPALLKTESDMITLLTSARFSDRFIGLVLAKLLGLI